MLIINVINFFALNAKCIGYSFQRKFRISYLLKEESIAYPHLDAYLFS